MTLAIKELEQEIWQLRRDYFVEHLFVPEHIKNNFDADDEYCIWVIDGLERQFIALVEDHWDKPQRIWVDKDGSVHVGSCTVGSGGIMMPVCYLNDGYWYDGDETQQVGQIALTGIDHWEHMVGEIKLQQLRVSNGTKHLIKHTYMVDDDE